MTKPIEVPKPAGNPALLPLQLAVGFFIAVKIYIDIAMPPIGDEAYYWLWGQKLAWSYFDHPPLHAWLLRLMDLLFGWNLFSLRILTWLTFGGTLAIFWTWSRRLVPAAPDEQFWRSTAIYLASPLFLAMTSIAFHDHLLIFLCLASAFFLHRFSEKWEAGRRHYGDLYVGALLIGLAVLTKYNAVLFAIGAALFFILRPQLHALFKTPHPYLAALLSIALQTPVLYWNLTEGFASFLFHTSERWDMVPPHFQALGLGYYFLVTIAVLSPFLIIPIGKALVSNASGFAQRLRALALPVFAVSSLAMAGLALFVSVFFYWNILAFLLLIPLAAITIGRRFQLWLHLSYGAALALGLAFNNTIVPLGNLTLGYDWTISSTFGWEKVAAEISRLKAGHPDAFIATTRYTTAAQLGYAMHDRAVTALSSRHDQYDFWFDAKAHKGQDALVVSDPVLGLNDVRPLFRKLTLIETLPIIRYGQEVYEPQIYLGEGFAGIPAN